MRKNLLVVCDTAKVRVFKQITTYSFIGYIVRGCLRYCKSTSFQANHNIGMMFCVNLTVVCDTAKVRVFKQITTLTRKIVMISKLFAILQKYEFSSKSQQRILKQIHITSCLRYCKSTSFQANHNQFLYGDVNPIVVCDTAKVRVFKQITTTQELGNSMFRLFAILQKYEFSSKSQHTS